MSTKLGPYPGRHESHASWDRRWREWECNRDRSRRELAARLKNYGGYNYHAVQHGGTYTLPDGTVIPVLWVGRGSKHKRGITAATASTPGSVGYSVTIPGNAYTGRTDYIVVAAGVFVPGGVPLRPDCDRNYDLERRECVYNCDDH